MEDSVVLKVFGQRGLGLFASLTLLVREIRKQYGVRVVGRIDAMRERYYAITPERKLRMQRCCDHSRCAAAFGTVSVSRPPSHLRVNSSRDPDRASEARGGRRRSATPGLREHRPPAVALDLEPR